MKKNKVALLVCFILHNWFKSWVKVSNNKWWMLSYISSLELIQGLKAKEKNSHNSQRICSPFVFYEPASIDSHTLSMSFYTFIRVSWPRRRDRPPSRGFYFILIRLLERDNFEYKKCLYYMLLNVTCSFCHIFNIL